jgi:YHS domain-containing protein
MSMRTYISSALAGALVLGLATATLAATKGEFDNMCTQGLAMGKDVQTDCSVNAIKGKTYCFGNEAAKEAFMKDPEGNLAKAQDYYSKKHPG